MSYYQREYYSDNPYYFKITPVVKGLMILYVSLFILQTFLFLTFRINLHLYLALNPVEIIEKLWFWQLVTYMFLHEIKEIIPLLFTLLALYFFGPEVEQHLGRKKFLTLYLLSGAFAGLAGVMMYVLQRNFTPIVAPYAALYGIVTYYACLYPYRTVWVMFVIPLQMRHLIGLIVLIHGFHILFQNVYSFCLLTGVFFGFAYFKYEPRFSNYFEKLEEQQEEKDRLSEKQLRKKVDELLEKISQEGIGHLTRKEKNFLKKASKQFKNPPP